MLPHRRFLLIGVLVLVGGSLAGTAGFGLRLRSEAYRLDAEAGLTRFFELPCDIGRIRGRTFSSRLFEDVVVWLPNRRDRVFSCREAVWHEHARDGQEENELELFDGALILGTSRWQHGDYRQVFQSGLGHDFKDLNLARVELSNFEIAFDRGDLAIRCRETSGTIDMTDPEDGIARLRAYELNGYRVSQGVQIDARFSPRNGVEVSELILKLPRVPLGVIGIAQALGGEVTSGQFSGGIQYARLGEEAEIWVRGDLEDADLSQLTRSVPFGPLAGRFSVNVYGARVVGSIVTHLRGRGRVTGFLLSPFAPLLGQSDLAGTADLHIDAVDVALGHVNRLRLSGTLRDLSLQQWLLPWGRGVATGKLAVRVNNLDIVDGDITSADVEITVVPPPGEAGVIDRALLLAVAEKAFDFTWPSAIPQRLLPEQLAYTEFGLRLLVQDNQLRVLGTHGPERDTILTVRVLGSTFGLVRERPGMIDLGPLLDEAQERIQTYDPRRVKEWLKSKGAPADRGSDPANP